MNKKNDVIDYSGLNGFYNRSTQIYAKQPEWDTGWGSLWTANEEKCVTTNQHFYTLDE